MAVTVTLTDPTDGQRIVPTGSQALNPAVPITYTATVAGGTATTCNFYDETNTLLATGVSQGAGVWSVTTTHVPTSFGVVAKAVVSGTTYSSSMAVVTIYESVGTLPGSYRVDLSTGDLSQADFGPGWPVTSNWPYAENNDSGRFGNNWRDGSNPDDDRPAKETTWPGWNTTPAAYRTAHGIPSNAVVNQPPPQSAAPDGTTTRWQLVDGNVSPSLVRRGAGGYGLRLILMKGDHYLASPTGFSNNLPFNYGDTRSTYSAATGGFAAGTDTRIYGQSRTTKGTYPNDSDLYGTGAAGFHREAYHFISALFDDGTITAGFSGNYNLYNGPVGWHGGEKRGLKVPGHPAFRLYGDGGILFKVSGSLFPDDNGGYCREFYLNDFDAPNPGLVDYLDNWGTGSSPTAAISSRWVSASRKVWYDFVFRFIWDYGPNGLPGGNATGDGTDHRQPGGTAAPSGSPSGTHSGLIEAWIQKDGRGYQHWFGPHRVPTLVAYTDNSTGLAPFTNTGQIVSDGIWPALSMYRNVQLGETVQMFFGDFGRATTLRDAMYPGSSLGAPVATTDPPVNAVLPVISGSPTQGQAIASDRGAWANSPTSYTYQWKRCDSNGANCSNIVGATSASYTLQVADVGSTLVCTVTATNANGSASATSVATAVVITPPAVIGKATVGASTNVGGQGYVETSGPFTVPAAGNITVAKLVAYLTPHATTSQAMRCVIYTDNGSNRPDVYVAVTNAVTVAAGGSAAWTDFTFASPVTLTSGAKYHFGFWYGGSVVKESYDTQTGAGRYTTAPYPASGVPNAGAAFGTGNGSNNLYSIYAPYTYAASAPSNTAAPSTSGSLQVGGVRQADPGTWDNVPTSYTYQWQQADDGSGTNAANISGQTSSTLGIPSIAAKYVRVGVVATNGTGSSSTVYSAWSGPVTAAASPGTGGSRPAGTRVAGTRVVGGLRVVGGVRNFP